MTLGNCNGDTAPICDGSHTTPEECEGCHAAVSQGQECTDGTIAPTMAPVLECEASSFRAFEILAIVLCTSLLLLLQ